MTFEIKRAERKHSRLRLAFCGPSGAGKTTTMLLVAKGLAQALLDAGILTGGLDRKIGVVDTERRSAALYAHLGPFDVIELDPPYTTARYLEAVRTFEHAGYPIIGVDQLSHAWAGSGGLLEKKEEIAKKNGRNDWNAFADITPEQNLFVDELLGSPAHLIVTMRSKTTWVVEKRMVHGQEKSVPKRLGLAPVQRAGTEYEFTTLLNLDTDGNRAQSIKDRTGLYPEGSDCGRLSAADGAKLAAWLYTGEAGDPSPRAASTPLEAGEALVTVWLANFANALSLPDLARDFEKAISAVKAVDVGGHVKKQWADRLIAGKDLRKAGLSPAAPLAGGIDGLTLDPEEVEFLEQAMGAVDVSMTDFQVKFGVQRLVQLPAARLEEAKAWIAGAVKQPSAA